MERQGMIGWIVSVWGISLVFWNAGLPAQAQTSKASPPKLTETQWKIAVAFEDDVDKKTIERWKQRMQSASHLLYKLTEGQIFIAECTVEDKTSVGDFVILKGLVGKSVIPDRNAMASTHLMGSPYWLVHSADKIDGLPGRLWTLGTVVVHELGHGVFGLPDERDTDRLKGIQCPNCIMGIDPTKLCGPKNHKGKLEKSCKEVIADLYGGKVKFPNPGFNPKKRPPDIRFKVTDRGKRDPCPELEPLKGKDLKKVQAMRAKGRAFDITVAFEGDVGEKLFRRWMQYVMVLDRILRGLTRNQFMIATCTLEDRKDAGTIVIEKGAEDQSVLKSNPQSMWTRTGKGWITAGLIPAQGLGRYLLAEWLKVQERNPRCPCYLNLGNWERPIACVVCSKGSHEGDGQSCEEKLVQTWQAKGVVPFSRIKKPMGLPRIRFTLKNNK
ncbi:MAG: hypothetical protein ACYTHN_12005 [Planctomycetota bacterium]